MLFDAVGCVVVYGVWCLVMRRFAAAFASCIVIRCCALCLMYCVALSCIAFGGLWCVASAPFSLLVLWFIVAYCVWCSASRCCVLCLVSCDALRFLPRSLVVLRLVVMYCVWCLALNAVRYIVLPYWLHQYRRVWGILWPCVMYCVVLMFRVAQCVVVAWCLAVLSLGVCDALRCLVTLFDTQRDVLWYPAAAFDSCLSMLF